MQPFLKALRFFFAGTILCSAILANAQDLAQTADQSALSQVLKASGTLFVRETHRLPEIATIGSSSSIECDVVIVRILAPLATLSEKDTTTVGLQLRTEEEYSERSAYVDIDEAEGLLASLKIISERGLDILSAPLVDGIDQTQRSSEIHYTTKEKISLGAFNYRGSLRFALKISSLADWALLTPNGADILAANLSRAVDIGRVADEQ